MANSVPYREVVGSLIFAATAARPDIAYITNILSRRLHKWGAVHWNAAKRVLRYLKKTKSNGLQYKFDDNDLHLTGYSDFDYAGDMDTRRSTTGYIFKNGDAAITWRTQLQKCVTCSTAEAEYLAASEATKEAIWLRGLLQEIGEKVTTIKLFVDNQSALKLIKNPVFHHRTKHIDIRYHFVREKFSEGVIDVNYVNTKLQIADIFTKALAQNDFIRLRNLLGMISIE